MVGCAFKTLRPVVIRFDGVSRMLLVERVSRTGNRADVSKHELDDLPSI